MLQVKDVQFHRLDMRTRFPFRYGIASLTELPHLFVKVVIELDGQQCVGVAADGLTPKWFTKNPDTSFDTDDLPNMQRVIRQAANVALQMPQQGSVYQWWRELYEEQHVWAKSESIPALLAGLGVSLLERAVIDAVCRQRMTPLFALLQSEIIGADTAHLPTRPASSVFLRHTVGMADPLVEEEINPDDHVHDGLPHSLEQCIDRYGLKYFKIKLSGRIEADSPRLAKIADVLRQRVGPSMRFTLDGNEQYRDFAHFREHWASLRTNTEIREMFDASLLFVEQPLHRECALLPDVKVGLQQWSEAPPIIIDESDDSLDSLSRALDLGYSGTSHKNCKGIFKSIHAAATIRRLHHKDRPLIHSAEDLGNVGPVALLQDLAVVAALGIEHVERNGHHYFAGLSMFPDSIQESIATDHDDLYERTEQGFVALRPQQGRLRLESVNRAPFGLAQLPDLSLFDSWEF